MKVNSFIFRLTRMLALVSSANEIGRAHKFYHKIAKSVQIEYTFRPNAIFSLIRASFKKSQLNVTIIYTFAKTDKYEMSLIYRVQHMRNYAFPRKFSTFNDDVLLLEAKHGSLQGTQPISHRRYGHVSNKT